jgi:hypothetical protein
MIGHGRIIILIITCIAAVRIDFLMNSFFIQNSRILILFHQNLIYFLSFIIIFFIIHQASDHFREEPCEYSYDRLWFF